MEWSQYNIVVDVNDEEVAIYNTFSDSFIVLCKKEFESISKGLINGDIELVNNGILVKEQAEQFHSLKYRMMKERFDMKTPTFYIAPTMDCNLACFYCFEDNNKSKSYMSTSTIDAVVDYIKSFGEQPVYIIWFGGEPLMAMKEILEINDKLKYNGVTFNSSMITNGTLLTESNISKLMTINPEYIQVTLDGVAETHDKRRIYKNGNGSFDRIIKNIDFLLKHSSIPVSIQVTVDRETKDSYKDIYEYISERYKQQFEDKHITVGTNYVQNRTNDENIASCVLSKTEQVDYLLGNTLWLPTEEALNSLYPERASTCMYNSIDTIAIDSKGKLYKCIEHIGDISKSIGDLEKKFIDDKLFSKAIFESDPFEDESCLNCNIFPICGGGCPIDRINLLKNNKSTTHVCPNYKDNMEKIMKKIYFLNSQKQTSSVC
ncbi:radical SAM protein [Ancylomarina sp. DW003]|nr:radical SAM protein [Ancylomarina sp. DW003]MDE5423193.1 radical SAM protein [Ancylomarina sp. DW003]